MANGLEPGKSLDRVILLFVVALLLFASPLLVWWSRPGSPWYTPYLLWAVVILLALWFQHRQVAR